MKEKEKEPAINRVMHPTPASEKVMEFLDTAFFGELEQPERITLHAIVGPRQKTGPLIRELVFKPGEKPSREKLVEICNSIIATLQTETDATGKTCVWGIMLHHLGRGDFPYGRLSVRLGPSGQTTALMERSVEDEENNVMSTRLLMQLLESERKDKRWVMEQSFNVLSGALEAQAERIERMEVIVDSTWEKQVRLMSATEQLLNQSAERDAKAQWARWKQQTLTNAIDKGVAVAELVLPQLVARKQQQQQPQIAVTVPAVADHPVGAFLASVQESEGLRAFGKIVDSENVSGGIFTNDQFRALVAIAKSAEPDPILVNALVTSISQDQIRQAIDVFGLERLMSLVSWLQSRPNGTIVQ